MRLWSIRPKLLMNDFAAKIIANSADTLETVARSYFEFWEGYIDILLLLNKAHLLYFVEDHLLSLIYEAALKSGHVSAEISKEILEKQYRQYQYEFAFKLAGILESYNSLVFRKSEKKTRRNEQNHQCYLKIRINRFYRASFSLLPLTPSISNVTISNTRRI